MAEFGIFRKYKIKSAGLYGSCAKREQILNSDVIYE